MTSLMISCNALFSFFKPSSNATAFPPHRLWRKPLTNTPRHRENFSTGTPKSSSASAPQSDDTAATLPNPARQNAMQIFVFDGFKRVLSVIKCQEFMPDPSDLASDVGAGLFFRGKIFFGTVKIAGGFCEYSGVPNLPLAF
jgi:hypothetical protein